MLCLPIYFIQITTLKMKKSRSPKIIIKIIMTKKFQKNFSDNNINKTKYYLQFMKKEKIINFLLST